MDQAGLSPISWTHNSIGESPAWPTDVKTPSHQDHDAYWTISLDKTNLNNSKIQKITWKFKKDAFPLGCIWKLLRNQNGVRGFFNFEFEDFLV